MATIDRVRGRSSLRPLKVPCFMLVETLQKIPDPSIQLDALALTFAAVCRGIDVDAHELVTRANRQLVDADQADNPHLEALHDYAKGELR